MDLFNFSTGLWSVLVFLYFSTKDYFLAKIFNHPEFKLPVWLTAIISIAALIVNVFIQSEYERYLGLSNIKGSIQLPNFTLLFILADAFSTIFTLGLIAPKKGQPMWKEPGARVLVEILRLTLLVVTVPSVISFFWTRETLTDASWDYQCFKYQVTIDLATYYYQNQQLPQNLEQFTVERVNPFNDSPLLYTVIGGSNVQIMDEKGNAIMDGYKDLLGLEMYAANPEQFFLQFEIANQNVCDGKLRLPVF